MMFFMNESVDDSAAVSGSAGTAAAAAVAVAVDAMADADATGEENTVAAVTEAVTGERTSDPDAWPWIVTENAAFARRVYNQVRRIYQAAPDLKIRRNKRLKKNALYQVRLYSPALLFSGVQRTALNGIPAYTELHIGPAAMRVMGSKKCCRKAMLRAAFLSAGSVSDPEKVYHFEIPCKRLEVAEFLSSLMRRFSLSPKIIIRNGYHIVYMKESGSIVDFLNVTGAHQALMSLENTRILKEMRNSVNRIVNCETANVGKTVNASVRQMENILFIQQNVGLENLPKNLCEIAEVRIANREIGLKELGQMLDPPLGKSGVNHRLRKLDAIALALRHPGEPTKG